MKAGLFWWKIYWTFGQIHRPEFQNRECFPVVLKDCPIQQSDDVNMCTHFGEKFHRDIIQSLFGGTFYILLSIRDMQANSQLLRKNLYRLALKTKNPLLSSNSHWELTCSDVNHSYWHFAKWNGGTRIPILPTGHGQSRNNKQWVITTENKRYQMELKTTKVYNIYMLLWDRLLKAHRYLYFGQKMAGSLYSQLKSKSKK